MIDLNTIYHEKCEETILRFSDNFIDLVVTSPPYNVDLGNNKNNKDAYDTYQDNISYEEHIKMLYNVFESLYSKMKKGGRIVINVGDKNNGAVPVSSDIIQFMKDIGYLPLTHIIWNKNQVGNRTAWGSWISPSCPSFPTPFEHILVFAKDSLKLQDDGKTDLTKKEFIDWSLSMWSFTPEIKAKEKGHPAPFPEELPKRCIKMFSWINSVVYDPYMGSGTTAIASKRLHRSFVGSEISKNYINLANKSLSTLCRYKPFLTNY